MGKKETLDEVHTTLAQIYAELPCRRLWDQLLDSLGGLDNYGDNTPLTFRQIYASNGYHDTLWCLRATDPKYFYLWRHFAVDAAQAVEPLMTDQRSRDALKVARRYADDKAGDAELYAARSAAKDAAWEIGEIYFDTYDADARPDAYARYAAARAAAKSAYAKPHAEPVFYAAAYADGAEAASSAVTANPEARRAQRAQIELLFEYCRTGKRPKNSGTFIRARIKEAK